MKNLTIVCLLILAGCGSPVKTTSTLPNMAGTWTGTINLQGSTPDLKVVLTQNSTGLLSGTASSVDCNFTMPVSGEINSNYTFSVQASSPTELLLAGNMSNNDIDSQGYATLQTGCSANGAPFALGRQ